ncbi:MAG: hypothetical protein IMF19_03955 [Proteobacteria bacterium]|nr:hypothetical protein [Pseudomonadota bacterium]
MNIPGIVTTRLHRLTQEDDTGSSISSSTSFDNVLFFSCVLKRVWKSNKENEKLVREGYAEIRDIPPSEFDPYEWEV